ncbi:MAG: redoxin domain-containing protein [Actinomycetota bacterium]|nr:redoxin domain-containing protein [Actinomycetota bacterium]MDQ3952782.1 redoxin domain-containing protein [Actinomycetota bacterium]
MITMPLPVAFVAWVLLIGLAVLVVIVYRQLAYLLNLSRTTERHESGLKVGEAAPSFEYGPALGEEQQDVRTFDPVGRPSLIMFTDPHCAICTEMLAALDALASRLVESGVRVVAATDAKPELVWALDAYRNTSLSLAHVDRDVTSRLYRMHVIPYAFGIDAQGVVRVARAIGQQSDMERTVEELLLHVSGRALETVGQA